MVMSKIGLGQYVCKDFTCRPWTLLLDNNKTLASMINHQRQLICVEGHNAVNCCFENKTDK